MKEKVVPDAVKYWQNILKVQSAFIINKISNLKVIHNSDFIKQKNH